ncbi:thiosulfate/3-mercaptopyruvate sulfurtransferase [Kytococcus aerolatus]|uniref:Thiosulfate/3-mercaptopyruvate sulfurtransferase n=1 Tax=Kytococcus aerolatus TaxID=592308 RepID=A0A212U2G2_9MICO|nr:rhodanese-like domain-containing protein [Kytococcus aerolatus]SNC72438.1 thiosulfate/3-mercaptopyruvate sulfurtransferase [Kytococcus aerolatus]
MDSTPFITPQELAARLETPAQHSGGRPVVLDVRWSLGGGADPGAFATGHVPGALFLDLEEVLTGPVGPDGAGGRHPLPAASSVRTWLDARGIPGEQPVVVLDAGHGAGAARAWWVLRDAGQQDVSVLEGGLDAWQEAGLPVEPGSAASTPPPEPPGPDDSGTDPDGGHTLPLVDAEDLLAGLPPGVVLLDARPAPRYRGEELGPDPVGGHVPGAVNLPAGSLYERGRLRALEELRQRFADAGVGPATPVVASCGSGITATQLVLAHQQAFPEAPEPTLYAGSFSDWISDPARPRAQGPEPGEMPGR